MLAAALMTIMLGLEGCRSCSGREKAGGGGRDGDSQIVTGVTDAHNARNSLDVYGDYESVEFDWNGYRVRSIITLSEDGYERGIWTVAGSEYDPLEYEAGLFSWNDEGNTITLEFAMGNNRYFVGENRLITLDDKGRQATDETLIFRMAEAE